MREDPRDVLLRKELQQIVNRDWNPLGLANPDNKYEGYMPGIQRMLPSGKAKLAWYLFQLEKLSFRLPGDRNRCERAAEKLVAHMMS